MPSPAVDAAIRSAPWAAVKSLGNTQPLATARDAGIPVRILRMYGIERLDASQAVAQWLSADLSVVTHVQLVCEDQRGYDAGWQQAVIDGLRNGDYRGRFLVGGFATGNPSQIVVQGNDAHFPEMEPIYPLLRRPDVDLAVDEYSGILASDPRWAVWAPYTAQRHRLIVADLARQAIAARVLITESGGDNVQPVTTGGGWRTRGWSANDYVALLQALDAGDQTDAAVFCRCVYTLNATPDWASYEIGGIVGALAEYVRGQGAHWLPPPGPAVVTKPVGTGNAPVPFLLPGNRKGHGGMPSALFQFDQGAGTLDCWVRCIESFFLRYGYSHDVDQIFQAGFGFNRPPGGQAAPFSVVKQAITTLAAQDGVKLQMTDLDNPGQVSAALSDPDTANPWTIIAGVAEQDLQPGQAYGHYIILERRDGDTVTVVDSLAREDGNQSGTYTWEQITAAMAANWDPTVDAVGVKIIG